MRFSSITCRSGGHRKQCRGITLLEVTLAAGILALLVSTSVQMLRVVAEQQRAADRRAVAIRTVQALAEQVGNLTWDELTSQAADRIGIPDAIDPYLPGAKLAVVVDEEADAVAAKRIAMELTWNSPNGQQAGPARITVWAFPDEMSASQ